MPIAKPQPEVTNLNRPYWEAAAQHRLLIQRCTGCGRKTQVATALCPECGGDLEWIEASGRGTLYTFTVFRQPYHPAFVDDVPYNVAIVELEEGPLMLTSVEGCECDALAIGMPLTVTFDDANMARFTPA
jgi:uncharacterized OB-fold protein